MRKILFVCMGMGIGGIEKTLVEALNSIDSEETDITLYVRKNRKDLLSEIDNKVNIIVNENSPHFEDDIFVKALSLLARTFRRMISLSKRLERTSRKYVLKKRQQYEKTKFFNNGVEYDFAVAYDMALECYDFVLNNIEAKKKICFVHSQSINEGKYERCKRFDKIIAVNSKCAENIGNNFPAIAEKVDSIENFIDPLNVVKMSEEDSPNIVNNRLTLCTCGRIAPIKGFDIATEAANMLKQEGVAFHWYFVGDGPERTKVEELIHKYSLENEITITGFLDNPFGYMKKSDIYIQPSEEEAHATTIVEAMILQKPIISTNTAAGKYFFEEYGCCILSEIDSADLANTILNLISSESCPEMIKKCSEIDWSQKEAIYRKKINLLFEKNY